MCSIHIYGSYVIGQNISLNKTFGQSLNQSAKSQFISRAACTPCARHLEPHYSEHPPYSAAIRQASISKRHGRPLTLLRAGAEFIKGNSFIVKVNRSMSVLPEESYEFQFYKQFMAAEQLIVQFCWDLRKGWFKRSAVTFPVEFVIVEYTGFIFSPRP